MKGGREGGGRLEGGREGGGGRRGGGWRSVTTLCPALMFWMISMP